MARKHIENIGLKGFFRLRIRDKKSRKIVADTGYLENQITNYGLNSCVVAAPIGANSVQAAGLILGSGGDPTSTTASLPGSNTDYYSTFGAAVIASLTARMTQTFDGSEGTCSLGNIGVLAASTGTLIAGKSYPTSTLATTQSVECTYELRYTTS